MAWNGVNETPRFREMYATEPLVFVTFVILSFQPLPINHSMPCDGWDVDEVRKFHSWVATRVTLCWGDFHKERVILFYTISVHFIHVYLHLLVN